MNSEERAKRISGAQTCRAHKKHTHIGSKHNHLTFIGLKQILLWDVINLTQNTSFGNCIVQNQSVFTKELALTELLGLNKHEGSLIWFFVHRGIGNFGDASTMSNLGMPVQLSNSLQSCSFRESYCPHRILACTNYVPPRYKAIIYIEEKSSNVTQANSPSWKSFPIRWCYNKSQCYINVKRLTWWYSEPSLRQHIIKRK